MSLYICPNPENIQQSEPQCKPWTWDDALSGGALTLTSEPLWGALMEGKPCMPRAGRTGNSVLSAQLCCGSETSK